MALLPILKPMNAPKGLNEDIIRFISAKKNEPEWMLEWRLKAFRHWLTMEEPTLGKCSLSDNQLPGYYLLFCSKAKNKTEKP